MTLFRLNLPAGDYEGRILADCENVRLDVPGVGKVQVPMDAVAEVPAPLPEEPPKPCPEGFHWIGQSGAWCDKCGLPSWKHDGMATVRRPASPYDETPWVLDPWKPGEREVMRRKWEPDLLAQQAERARTQPTTQEE